MSKSKATETQESKEWTKFRDTKTFNHAVSTLGSAAFADVVMTMIVAGVPVTRDSFEKEIHEYMDMAIAEKSNERYYTLMIAHSFFSRFLFRSKMI